MHGATCCVLASLLLLDTGLALEFPISAFVRYVDGLRTASAANLLRTQCIIRVRCFAAVSLQGLHPADGGSQVESTGRTHTATSSGIRYSYTYIFIRAL